MSSSQWVERGEPSGSPGPLMDNEVQGERQLHLAIKEEREESELTLQPARSLFQPFLSVDPSPPSPSLSPPPLPFSIESILKPDFGEQNTFDKQTHKAEADEDCPPGMVRGPNGQLWPAWVFCTRYSDRPSSGG